jgi:Bacterial protein of unknown function (DUF882)
MRAALSKSLQRAAVYLWLAVVALGCGRSSPPTKAQVADGEDADSATAIPQYTTRQFTPEERELLRRVYGVEDPSRLYLVDQSQEGVLKYDTKRKTCPSCLVNSYRIGFVSVRRPGESWEQTEQRVRSTPLTAFPDSAHVGSTSTAALDPAVRGDVEHMLADARAAGFDLHVVATFRSPVREAYLMRQGHRTYTLTSLHSYGRAIDIVIGDARLKRPATRQQWIAFRRWVGAYHDGEFRIIGKPDRTWDWRHVEVPSPDIGFRSIEAALDRARACSAQGSNVPCDFKPYECGESECG